MKYIVYQEFHEITDEDLGIYVVNTDNKEEAIRKYIQHYTIKDSDFLESVYNTTIGYGLIDYFCYDNGDYIFEYEEDRENVPYDAFILYVSMNCKKFFNNDEWSNMFIENLEKTLNITTYDLDEYSSYNNRFLTFPDDMLIHICLNYGGRYRAIELEKIEI